MQQHSTVFICGEKKDHVCDNDGPFVYFMRNGTVTFDRVVAERRGGGCSGGATTCSVCGSDSMSRSLMGEGDHW